MSSNEKDTQKPAPNTVGFGIIAQYVKDLSFENPNAPAVYTTSEKPQIDMGINVKAQKTGDNTCEVSLLISVKANGAEKSIFMVELNYSGLFSIPAMDEKNLEPLLLVDAPFILYPFARRIVADVTRDGGFPPLLLDPINFAAMYLDKKKTAA